MLFFAPIDVAGLRLQLNLWEIISISYLEKCTQFHLFISAPYPFQADVYELQDITVSGSYCVAELAEV